MNYTYTGFVYDDDNTLFCYIIFSSKKMKLSILNFKLLVIGLFGSKKV